MLSLFKCLIVLLAFFAVVICSPKAEAAVVNGNDFPLVGDGKTDNQVVLEQMLQEATLDGGATIIIPPGFFVHSGRLTIPGNSVLTGPGSGGAALIGITPSAQTVTLNGNNIRISNIGLFGVTGSDPGVQFANVKDILFNNSEVERFTTCIKSMSCTNLTLINSVIDAAGGDGIAMNFAQTKNITMNGCFFGALNISPSIATGIIISGGDKVSVTGCGASRIGTVLNVSGNAFTSFQFNGNLIFNSQAVILGLFNSNDGQILQNTMQNAGNVYLGNGNKHLRFEGNNVNGASIAVISNNDSDISVSQNTLQNCQTGIQLSRENQCKVDSNTLTNSSGIEVDSSNNLRVTNNTLTNMQQQGVLALNNTGQVLLNRNTMTSCGLSPSVNPPAVIYANCPSANFLQIFENSYVGNTAHLSYFIDTPQANADVYFNFTNTMLPSKVGP